MAAKPESISEMKSTNVVHKVYFKYIITVTLLTVDCVTLTIQVRNDVMIIDGLANTFLA